MSVRDYSPCRVGSAFLVAALLAPLASCVDRDTEDTAMRRGDVAFAADSLGEALAEYRLAVRQGSEDPALLARVAHTYVELGRVDEAASFYRLATDLDPAWGDQAAADLMHLAHAATGRRDRFLLATAVEEALAFRPGLGLGDLALPLARHYAQNGEFGRALPLYDRVLAAADTLPVVLFEIGQAHEEVGDCRQALLHFERYREAARRPERDQVDWYIGTCAYELARELRASPQSEEDLEEALGFVTRAIEVGEPRNIQGRAWFDRGEILAELGACDAAMEAFAQVRIVEPVAGGALVDRAQDRFDAIRFGRGLGRFRRERGCY